MIRYQMACDHGHSFEGWFRGSADFDAQLEQRSIVCPACGSHEVAKQLMTPSVSTARAREARRNTADEPAATSRPVSDAPAPQTQVAVADPRMGELVEAMRKIRKHVVENSENVGKRFAEEARAMHFGEKAMRGIYGEATAEDTSALLEDGIEVYPLPVLPEDRN